MTTVTISSVVLDIDEVPIGAVDGENRDFVTSHDIGSGFMCILRGLFRSELELSITGTRTFRFIASTIPMPGDVLRVRYRSRT